MGLYKVDSEKIRENVKKLNKLKGKCFDYKKITEPFSSENLGDTEKITKELIGEIDLTFDRLIELIDKSIQFLGEESTKVDENDSNFASALKADQYHAGGGGYASGGGGTGAFGGNVAENKSHTGMGFRDSAISKNETELHQNNGVSANVEREKNETDIKTEDPYIKINNTFRSGYVEPPDFQKIYCKWEEIINFNQPVPYQPDDIFEYIQVYFSRFIDILTLY